MSDFAPLDSDCASLTLYPFLTCLPPSLRNGLPPVTRESLSNSGIADTLAAVGPRAVMAAMKNAYAVYELLRTFHRLFFSRCDFDVRHFPHQVGAAWEQFRGPHPPIDSSKSPPYFPTFDELMPSPPFVAPGLPIPALPAGADRFIDDMRLFCEYLAPFRHLLPSSMAPE
jgi:hypothetical protein